MKKKLCLYFDDEINEDNAPLTGMLKLIQDSFPLEIERENEFNSLQEKLTKGSYDLLFLDIRISEEKGGGIDNRSWQRTGTSLLKRIRDGKYEPGTKKEIPIIVITAVGDTVAQSEITNIGKGENNQFKFTLFEKPADEDEVGKTAIDFVMM
jgi:CheY-like chemotaxis protein